MSINKLFPVTVGELFRNALAVKRSLLESTHDELYGLPGDRVPYGWLQVEKALARKFSQSPKTIDEIIGLLRDWEEFSITVIRERFDLRPALNITNNGEPLVLFELVAKGSPFQVPTEAYQEWYLRWLKQKTQLLEIEYESWASYWRDTVESDETRRIAFRRMELGDALKLIGPCVEENKPSKAKKLTKEDLRIQRDDWLLDVRGVGEEPLCTWEEALEELRQKYDETSWPHIDSRGGIEAAWKRAWERRFNTPWGSVIDNRGKNKGKQRERKTDHGG